MTNTVQQLQAQAAEDYRKHQENAAQLAAAARDQVALARSHGNESGGTPGSTGNHR
ncbi:hypothetical protein V1460_04490 [Streptomyces sp. SCSIO 30461]|uniref:hypothetical protein n=1 Tax=Streptomyces sp. SCSIO 30461 TaxID=3118085 RepID=UPI0030D3B3BF